VAKRLPAEAVLILRRRLEQLAPRDPERARLVASVAELYGVTRSTLYRALQGQFRPRAAQRVDKGIPRAVPMATLERYCEIIAALKLRTTNGKGRHLSTWRAIALLEEHGVETKDGLVRAPQGVLKRPTSQVEHVAAEAGRSRASARSAPGSRATATGASRRS
jgi:hypothetical protein